MRFSRSKLFTAIRKDDLAFVKDYLKLGVDVNLTEKVNGGLTPIEFAAYKNNTEISKIIMNYNPDFFSTERLIFWTTYHSNNELFSLFIKQGAPINQIDDCLYEACTRDNSYQIDILIKKGANVNYRRDDLSPLHRVARYGSFNSLKLLVENGANVNVKDKNGKTPFNYAVLYDKFEIVEYLFDHGCVTSGVIEKDKFYLVGSREMLDFYFVLLKNDQEKLEVFKKELSKRLKFRQGGKLEESLKQSIISADLAAFQDLISKYKKEINLNINYKYNDIENVTPLHLAVICRNYEMVKTLLENGAETKNITSNRYTVYDLLESDEYDEETLSIIRLIKEHDQKLYASGEDKDFTNKIGSSVEKRDGVFHIKLELSEEDLDRISKQNKRTEQNKTLFTKIKNLLKSK